jgi:hypothetical protein
MISSKWTLVALSAALAIGIAGSADAASKKKNQNQRINHIGHFYISKGDSVARINKAFPEPANPPSLRQEYNLRTRKMNESVH